MKVSNSQSGWLRSAVIAMTLMALASPWLAQAQQPTQQDLAARIDAMQKQLDATQKELEEYRAALKALQEQVRAAAQPAATTGEADAATLQQAVTEIREEQAAQQAEIAVHEQTKVGTLSRYSLKIGGLILFNAFGNDGAVDSVDVPVLAVPRTVGASNGSLGASLRQSLLTLDATGPKIWGASTYGNLQMDFYGDLSTSDYTSQRRE